MFSRNMVFVYTICISLFVLIASVSAMAVDTDDDILTDSVILELYRKYKEAIGNDADFVVLRRQFDQNRLFEIHVKKLKEVNGFKQHNLMIKGKARSGSVPFIYINNPVESRLPHAYLTLEEFKEALTTRVEKQRYSLTTQKQINIFDNQGIYNMKNPKIKTGATVIYNYAYNNNIASKNTLKDIPGTKKSNEAKKSNLRTPKKKNQDDSTLSSQVTRKLIQFITTSSTGLSSTMDLISAELYSNNSPEYSKLTTRRDSKSKKVTTAKIEDLLFLKSAAVDDDKIQAEENKSHSEKNVTNSLEKVEYSEHIVGKIEYTGTPNITELEVKADNVSVNETNFITEKDYIKYHDETVILTTANSNNDTESFNDTTEVFLNETSYDNVQNSNVTLMETTGETHGLTNITEIPRPTPKRLVPNIESITFSHQPPWRKRESTTKATMKTKSNLTKRSTLGRPLVFIGGP